MHIEDRLGQALSEAADGCAMEAQPLLERGLRRGLRLRRRRRIVTVAGASLAVTLLGAAIGYGVRTPSGRAPATTAPAFQGSGSAMSGQEILTLLESLLPPGKITQPQAVGAGGGRPAIGPATASLVFDDGRGPARFELGAAPTGNKDVVAPSECPTLASTHGTCRQTRLRDGSVVAVSKTSFNGRTGTAGSLQWSGTIVTPAGDRLWLAEYNYSAKGFPSSGTRPPPPLTDDQLVTVVADKGWKRLFTAIRTARPDHQLTQKQVIGKTVPLLPAGMNPPSVGSNQEGIAVLQLDGRALLDVNVTRWPGTAARSEIAAQYYAHAQELPDGTLLLVDQKPDHNRVYALRPDGTSVQLTVNGLMRVDGSKPLPLSVAQLRKIALDPTWTH